MLTLLQTLQLEFGTAILYLSVDATSVTPALNLTPNLTLSLTLTLTLSLTLTLFLT